MRYFLKRPVLLACLPLLMSMVVAAQEHYPVGITIDPGIEKICRSKKGLNTFSVARYVNDSPDTNQVLGLLGKLPLNGMVNTRNNDTTITFMNMLVPQGFQLQFKNDSATVEIFVASKHCECFKSDLSDSVLRYGAGATPSSVTLVLSKRSGLKAGDEVFGYIKTTGGTIYRVADPGNPGVFDKWRHEYEGYFRFVMKEMF